MLINRKYVKFRNGPKHSDTVERNPKYNTINNNIYELLGNQQPMINENQPRSKRATAGKVFNRYGERHFFGLKSNKLALPKAYSRRNDSDSCLYRECCSTHLNGSVLTPF